MISFNASMKAVATEIIKELCAKAQVDPANYEVVVKVTRKKDGRLVDFAMDKWAKETANEQ